MNAPIVLFTYNRLKHTQLTLKALLSNYGSHNSDLIVFSDGPRSIDQLSNVKNVREYLHTISGFRSIKIYCRDKNFGLAESIISGVTQTLNKYDRVIVMEDDLITSPYFLNYMNEALDRFVDEEHVISIHGYVYPVKGPLPEAFFLRGADCWGWATWRSGWEYFNSDGQILLDELKYKKLTQAFDFNGAYPYTKMLESQIAGRIDSWAIRWYASAYLSEKLTLYPGRSLVKNIGNDLSGTHCNDTDSHDTILSKTPIDLKQIAVQPSSEVQSKFEKFFQNSQKRHWKRAVGKLKRLGQKLA